MLTWVVAELLVPTQLEAIGNASGLADQLAHGALVEFNNLQAHLLEPLLEESLWPDRTAVLGSFDLAVFCWVCWVLQESDMRRPALLCQAAEIHRSQHEDDILTHFHPILGRNILESPVVSF